MGRDESKWWQGNKALRVKRLIDIAGASLGLVLAAPVMMVTGAALCRSGAVLFRQQRPGYRGETFEMRKFRTMREPTPGENRYRSDDERTDRLGKFLRKTSIDELPELWNVLVGDMSLVGPRPLLVEYLPKYTAEESRRHQMPPGITGWAQVNGRQNITFSQRLALDVWYVDNWSLALDLKILARTLGAIIWDSHEAVGSAGLDAVDDIGLSADRERKGAA